MFPAGNHYGQLGLHLAGELREPVRTHDIELPPCKSEGLGYLTTTLSVTSGELLPGRAASSGQREIPGKEIQVLEGMGAVDGAPAATGTCRHRAPDNTSVKQVD